MEHRLAKFAIGQVVKHRIFPFRGVIFDVDPQFANTEEWWRSIPEEIRPRKDQPFYHLLAENDSNAYVAYVSEQNLLPMKRVNRSAIRRPMCCSTILETANTTCDPRSVTDVSRLKSPNRFDREPNAVRCVVLRVF